MKCPFCNMEMEHYEDHLDGWLLMESADRCQNGHYVDAYYTGNYEIHIFDTTFRWTHRTPYQEVEILEKAADNLMEVYKELLLRTAKG